jgi:hypothetical protein
MELLHRQSGYAASQTTRNKGQSSMRGGSGNRPADLAALALLPSQLLWDRTCCTCEERHRARGNRTVTSNTRRNRT